jgi:hypothetical protein
MIHKSAMIYEVDNDEMFMNVCMSVDLKMFRNVIKTTDIQTFINISSLSTS